MKGDSADRAQRLMDVKCAKKIPLSEIALLGKNFP
jgi:hypothetical protein